MVNGLNHHLTTTLHLTVKMTNTQVVKTSVTNNSLSKGYPHPEDHDKQITANKHTMPSYTSTMVLYYNWGCACLRLFRNNNIWNNQTNPSLWGRFDSQYTGTSLWICTVVKVLNKSLYQSQPIAVHYSVPDFLNPECAQIKAQLVRVLKRHINRLFRLFSQKEINLTRGLSEFKCSCHLTSSNLKPNWLW